MKRIEMNGDLSKWGLLSDILFTDGKVVITPESEYNGYKGTELVGAFYSALFKEGIRVKVRTTEEGTLIKLDW